MNKPVQPEQADRFGGCWGCMRQIGEPHARQSCNPRALPGYEQQGRREAGCPGKWGTS